LKLRKIKRPAGIHVFDVESIVEDNFGVWLYIPRGSKWEAPHTVGTLRYDFLLLLSSGRLWVAKWVDDPVDRRLEIDICLAPEREDDGWRYIDLELDPIRYENGLISIEDRDEFEIACRNGWITSDEAVVAHETAVAMEAALRKRDEPLGDEGWLRLEALRQRRVR
jgi:hypothetical protein